MCVYVCVCVCVIFSPNPLIVSMVIIWDFLIVIGDFMGFLIFWKMGVVAETLVKFELSS